MVQPIPELLQNYKEAKRARGLSQVTINRVVFNVEMFIGDSRIVSVDQLTTQAIITWGNYKLDTCSRSTLYTYFNSLRAFLNYLDECDISYNVDKTRVHCKPLYKERTWLRPGQIRHIIRQADTQTGILIRLMYTSGMRVSEAISLTDAHTYEGTTLYILSKGGRQRPVFITERLLGELQTLATANGGFCFVDEIGAPLTRKKAYYYVKKACKRAGYPNCHPHTFRHSFCTELLRKGVSLSHASRLMGHANVSITQIYEHLIVDDIERAHMKLTRV